MSSPCVKCGALLAEGQSFCTACGTRVSVAPAVERPQFCRGCGTPLAVGAKFCEKCGISAMAEAVPISNAATVPASGPQLVYGTAPAPAPTPAVPPRTGSGGKILKFLMIATGLFGLLLIGVMGSCAYIAYRAKQRFNNVEQAYKKNDLSGMIAAAKGDNDKPHPLPDWKPASADLISSPAGKIPFRESLRLINAGTDELSGDYESIFQVDKITDKFVHVRAAQEFPAGQGVERWLNNGTTNNKPRKINCSRTEFQNDIESSVEFDGLFCREGRDEKHPGTLAMSFSRKTFNDLKKNGHSDFSYHEDPLKSVMKSFKKAMASDSPQSTDAASQDLLKKMMSFAPGGVVDLSDNDTTPPLKGTLHRNSNTDLAFPVMVNDQPAELPVMDVLVTTADREAHAYVLDDPEHPLVLATASTTASGRDQIIRIYWDTKAPDQLEQELEKNGRAKVYDLYFDFASDVLRPESGKVLDEIAQVMRAHPDWKLGVEGNTDNIGGDASNLDLSKRRAAAVVRALSLKYLVPANRFTSTGFGASHPVDTNATPEGRARNRRVELARLP